MPPDSLARRVSSEPEVIKVGVLGARGRMGSLVAQTVLAADDLDLVAEVDLDLAHELRSAQP